MKNFTFYKYFLEFIQDIYDAENQIVESLPLMIKESTNKELKEGLSKHLEETKEQVKRLKKVFSILNETPKAQKCLGMAGLIDEGKKILENPSLVSVVKDCFIIVTAQKIEHYEISSYGSAITLVKHMKAALPEKDAFKEIQNLLEDTLKEEGNADKKLTQVAEGKLFTTGVNEEIEKELKARV